MSSYESVENLMLQINMTKPGKEGVLAIILDRPTPIAPPTAFRIA